tara:strand:+ start:326 stop:505 length:180 start_codon:yes stop_codon:yes gene_type:complete
MITYFVICIALIIFLTVIFVVIKPIIKGFKARQNIKDLNNKKSNVEVSDLNKIKKKQKF